MIIPVCTQCPYGTVRDHQSHCGKEKCYSYLTKCIADQALADYLQRVRDESSIEVATPTLSAYSTESVLHSLGG